MKYLLVFVCLLFTINTVLSQDITVNSIKITIPSKRQKGAKPLQLVLPIVTKDSIANTLVDIKAENWDTSVFNPYKETLAKFPLKLNFKDSTYVSPIPKKKVITSRYGWRHGRAHKGIDIDLITGDSVVAMLSGIVRFASYNRGHGKTVILRHYNGLETIYAHLSAYAVKANDTVKKGQLIAKGGNTGNSRGSHLHLVTSYKGNYIHPEYLFDFSAANKIRSQELWVTRQWTRPNLYSSKRKPKLELLLSKGEAIASLEKELKVYVVRRGDTLSRIANRNSLSIASICKTNLIKKSSVLKIGQKLILEI